MTLEPGPAGPSPPPATQSSALPSRSATPLAVEPGDSTRLVALVGNPNCGKSALFNALTGARQKVGNYPGVTVERHAGRLMLPNGAAIELIDLPGAYSLSPASPDEQVTRDVLMGSQAGERLPDALVIVVDASNLEHHLRFALELIALGRPTVLALNMADLARRDGLVIDTDALSVALGVPVVETVAVRKRGIQDLAAALEPLWLDGAPTPSPLVIETAAMGLGARQKAARALAREVTQVAGQARRWSARIDRVALHRVFGPLLLLGLLFVMFQAVFTLATYPADAIDTAFQELQAWVIHTLPPGLLRDALVDGVIAGVGAVIVFLPLILILFFFILLLEASGYMVRAAFLMDRLMARVGLSGRAFIPLLSSFACAVPGIMATRTIDDPRDRLTTILIAPLMTCSARLPVYAVIIAAFIPDQSVLPGIGLQGLVLFGLYLAGILGALLAASLLRRTVTRGRGQGFLMEMPKYHWPAARDIGLGLWGRAILFLKRAGTIIALSTLILWALLAFPRAPEGASQRDHSIAGQIATLVEPVVRPIGFNREIALALIPAMAAREVAISALGTVYAVEAKDEAQQEQSLIERLRGRWSLPTALAFLAWFVFAPQCISTIAIVRRETNGWRWPAFMVAYLFALAYGAAGLTYWIARAAM